MLAIWGRDKTEYILLRRLRVDGHRPQARILLPQCALDLLGLNMRLAQGDVRVKKRVQHKVEFFMMVIRSISKF